ncbi:hypothetical protein M0812_02059 [Anaeramoeba flamelloides]|uniref:Cellulase n=1 Tax=Anaeramoeba flamelloides TaxID=1746091 RepID=A0AAV7Z1T4_9EUKA|nr:hypothetical protein M0812_02059 [Anaeramoeba flamelloides]
MNSTLNLENFITEVNNSASVESLRDSKYNISMLANQKEQEAIQYIWNKLPENYPTIKVSQEVINEAMNIAKSISSVQQFGDNTMNTGPIMDNNIGMGMDMGIGMGMGTGTGTGTGINYETGMGLGMDMQLDNLGDQSDVPSEVKEKIPDEVLSMNNKNTAVSNSPPKSVEQRTTRPTTYRSSRSSGDDYVPVPCLCFLFLLSWGLILGLCIGVAKDGLATRYWDKHVVDCDAQWLMESQTASYHNSKSEIIEAKIVDGCAPRMKEEELVGTFTCWSDPDNPEEVLMIPGYLRSAPIAAMTCGLIFGIIMQIVIFLAFFFDYGSMAPIVYFMTIPSIIILLPVIAFFISFVDKKLLWAPLVGIAIFTFILYFPVVRVAKNEANKVEEGRCKVYDFGYNVDCPYCYLGSIWCNRIFPKNIPSGYNETTKHNSSPEYLSVKLYPKDIPEIDENADLYKPWIRYYPIPYTTYTSERLLPTINDEIDCFIEKDYKYDASDPTFPLIITGRKVDRAGYKAALSFIIILGVVLFLIFLCSVKVHQN